MRALAAAGLVVSVAVVVLGVAHPADAAPVDDARRAAGDVPEIAAVLQEHPDAVLVGGPTEDGTWVFEIVAADRELGFVVLSADLEVIELDIVEGGFRDEPTEPRFDDEDASSPIDLLTPRPDGALYLWVSLGLVMLVVWGWPGWRGRLLSAAVIVWGVTWHLFWNDVVLAQLVLWLTNLVTLGAVAGLLISGRQPLLAIRRFGRRELIAGGLLLGWLAWLAMASAGVEDSAIWAARGGRYLIDEGAFPYGALGEGATYGPVQYLVHAPLTVIWAPGEIGQDSFTAARIVALAAVLAIAWAVWSLLGRDRVGAVIAVLAVPWFPSVVSVANVSQLVPIAATLVAFVAVRRGTAWSSFGGGVAIAVGAGAMFVPAFAVPALIVASDRRWREVVGGIAVVTIAVVATVVGVGTDLATVWNDTVRFQETAYAAEGGLSLWGQFDLEEWRSVGKLLHAAVLVTAVAGAARYRSMASSLLAAGVGIGGVLLWKGHVGPWGYLTWFVPLLLVGAMLAGRADPGVASAPDRGRELNVHDPA